MHQIIKSIMRLKKIKENKLMKLKEIPWLSEEVFQEVVELIEVIDKIITKIWLELLIKILVSLTIFRK